MHNAGRPTPDGRAGNWVRSHGLGGLTVDINVDTWVVDSPCTGDRDEVCGRREGRAATCDDKIGAFGVELRSVGLVEGKQLESNQVCTRLEGGRDGSSPIEGIHDLSVSPGSVVYCSTEETGFVNLEPL